jgi:hypothetical protein
VVLVDLVTGRAVARVVVDGRPAALRADAWRKRLALRIERVLLSLDLEEIGEQPRVRALVGALSAHPSTHDGNVRIVPGPPAGIECLDDDGAPRWSLVVGGSSAVYAAGFLVGGEVLLTATHTSGDRVLIARDGGVIFERPRAGGTVTAGALARVSDRAAVVVAPGALPGAPVEFGTTMEVANVRGGGCVAFERSPQPAGAGRMLAVDPAGAVVVEVTEGGAGARWAAASEGLLAVPRTNGARIDLYDYGAPA